MVEWRGPFAVRPQKTDSDPLRADTPVFVAPEYAVPQSAYAVPPLSEGDAYNDEFGWGPVLHTSPISVPDAQRVGSLPTPMYGEEHAEQPAQLQFWAHKDADISRRHSVEDVHATGWKGPRGFNPGDRRWVDNPRRDPPQETRATSGMAPTTYSFMRPFDQGYARQLNGTHFSMASNMRTYDIMTMQPATSRRNTYRIEPTPWDVDVVDMPPAREPITPQARTRGVEVPSGSRSWRL